MDHFEEHHECRQAADDYSQIRRSKQPRFIPRDSYGGWEGEAPVVPYDVYYQDGQDDAIGATDLELLDGEFSERLSNVKEREVQATMSILSGIGMFEVPSLIKDLSSWERNSTDEVDIRTSGRVASSARSILKQQRAIRANQKLPHSYGSQNAWWKRPVT
ncbi:hypothetical protein K435DRAFT_802705 [Dendrothele bispora CBS 962.96]|uniref:Uncharacterized protein n=1 Tax=Dendrothele bispora (strain CBS 962.96) TaxID=1314807 RepID=A0A4S8LKE3_DENBC|nr:hypothetical protein K435DRAFT_802705 [Dendrothele bispora CBS 962.96]